MEKRVFLSEHYVDYPKGGKYIYRVERIENVLYPHVSYMLSAEYVEKLLSDGVHITVTHQGRRFQEDEDGQLFRLIKYFGLFTDRRDYGRVHA